MIWALLIQVVILGFGLVGAGRARSMHAAVALALGPVSIGISAALLGWLPLWIGLAGSVAVLSVSAVLNGWQSRRHFARADAEHDLAAREVVESLAGSLLANAVYAGVVAMLAVVLGWLMTL